MFLVEKFHNRMESINGDWFFDGEPITDTEAAHLRLHYRDLCAKLKEPWANKDRWYDETGRVNYAGQQVSI